MLSKQYWNSKYDNKNTGWDIGYPSPPIIEYFNQLNNKQLKILIPGAGKAWEAEHIYKLGFVNTYVLDFSQKAIDEFKGRCPFFPENQIICTDFFQHSDKYDIIVEQTFFSSLPPKMRQQYVTQVHNLLNNNGTFIGVLFNHEFTFQGPPFGGSEEEYKSLFKELFVFKHFITANNSIKPRKGRELFLLLRRK